MQISIKLKILGGVITTKTLKKGFTLIELLIVIVIIGLLAAVVIAAINPVETRNRAVDTGLKSDAAEVYNAIERYYASRGAYTWAASAPTNGSTVAASGVVAALVTAGELKSEFANRQTLSTLLFYFDGTNNVKICFNPASTSFDEQAVYTASASFVTRGTASDTGLVCVPE